MDDNFVGSYFFFVINDKLVKRSFEVTDG